MAEPEDPTDFARGASARRQLANEVSSSREFRILCLVARCELSPGERERLRELLDRGVDWERLWDGAGRHGLLPFLHRGLEAVEADDAPEPIIRELAEHAARVARRNLHLTATLVRLLEAWRALGVAALPFKGPVLADTLYPDPGLRTFSDLDVLVRPEDLRSAVELLEEQGFRPRRALAGGRERAFRWQQYAHPFLRAEDGVAVDLHWRFAPSWLMSGVRMDRIRQSTEPWEVCGTTLRRLSPEATLLTLCLHGAKHGPVPWPRLLWLCDLAALSRSRLEDGGAFLDYAASHGCLRIVLLGLWLTRKFLDAPVPPAVERAFEHDPRIEDLARPVERGLKRMRVARMDAGAKLRWEVSLRERRRDRIRVLAHRALMPRRRDRETASLPRWLAFLYVPIRVGRLLLQYVSGGASASSRDPDGGRPDGAAAEPTGTSRGRA